MELQGGAARPGDRGRPLAEPRFRALAAQLLGAGPNHPALLAAYLEHHVRPRRERARAAMSLAKAEGVLDEAADVDVLIDMMEGAIVQHLLLRPDPPEPAEISAYLRRLLTQAGFRLRSEAERAAR